MSEKEIKAINDIASEISAAAALFVVQASEGESVIQYDDLNSQTTVRFFSAFSINKSTSRKAISNHIAKKYKGLKKPPRIIITDGIAVVIHETTLSPIFGYRNRIATLVNFLNRNICITIQYAKCGKEK